jgi:putative endonuclease
VVYGAALEKRSPVIPERGFESHPLRQPTLKLRLAGQLNTRARQAELYGEVLEWPIRHAWRACVAVRLPWVRIPPSPPAYAKASAGRPANTKATDSRPDYDKAMVATMWYVYILRSTIDKRLYVGSTNNINRRLAEHNSGKVDSTKNRAPLSLEAYFAIKNRARAIELEQYLKTGSGRALLQKRIL